MAETVSSLLRQAPPGEQEQVASALRALLAGDAASLVDAQLPAAAEAHNLAHLLVAELPSPGGKLLLSPDAQLEGGLFLEPRAGLAVQFDHVARACTSARAATAEEKAPAEVEPYRRAAESKRCCACSHPHRLAIESALEPFVREVYAPNGVVRQSLPRARRRSPSEAPDARANRRARCTARCPRAWRGWWCACPAPSCRPRTSGTGG